MANLNLEHSQYMAQFRDDKNKRLAAVEIMEVKAMVQTLHKKHQEAMKEVGQSKLLLEQAKDNEKRRVRGGNKGLYIYE